MPDFILSSLRGGMNNTDPSIAIPEDQSVLAQNVEYVESMLGERRLGTTAISLPSFLSLRDRIPFLFRHLPSADETGAELWALGVTGTSAAHLGHKTTSWTEITISDTPTLTGFGQYRWRAVTLHGKVHFAYVSNQDRLHVWDGTTMRRSGLAEPAAPTAANSGSSGSLVGTRYYRVRYTEQVTSVTVRRSEPSDTLTFAPDGSHVSITITKPAGITEGETHWELEASEDDANYYVLATTLIATPTVVDTTAYSTGYSAGVLSEDIGDYALIPSARHLVVDGDRLVWGGHPTDAALASRVGWSPVFNASGVGNDERMETDTDPTVDLDTYQHGPVTDISPPVLGGIWIGKTSAVYKMTRTDQRTQAYNFDLFTDALGVVEDSMVAGVDATGQPCLYAIDPTQGPFRIGVGGIKRAGEDLRTTWKTLNVDATKVVLSGIYYPTKKQVVWCLATGDSDVPDTAIVLHVDKSRDFADGVRKGWTIWTGTRAAALSMCLFSTNIDDNAARNLNLVPFIGLEGGGLLHRCDVGSDDNGTAYVAKVITKPYAMTSILHQFEVRAAAVLAKAVSGSSVDVTCIRDFGLEDTITVKDVSFSPTITETSVIKALDDFKGAEMRVGQVQFSDVDSPAAQWSIDRFDMLGTPGQQA